MENKDVKDTPVFSSMFGRKDSSLDDISSHIVRTSIFTSQNLNETKKITKNTGFLVKVYSNLFKHQELSNKLSKNILSQHKDSEKRIIDREKAYHSKIEKKELENKYSKEKSQDVIEQKLTNDLLSDILKKDVKEKKDSKKGIFASMFGNIGKIFSDAIGSIPFGKALAYGLMGIVAFPLIKKIIEGIIKSDTLKKVGDIIWTKMIPEWLKDTIDYTKKMFTDPKAILKDIGLMISSSVSWLWDQFYGNWVKPSLDAIGRFVDTGVDFFKDPLKYIFQKKSKPIKVIDQRLFEPVEKTDIESTSKQLGISKKEARSLIETIRSGKSIPIKTAEEVLRESSTYKPQKESGSAISNLINRINQYDKIIKNTSEKFNVPTEVIKGIMARESRGIPGAKSGAGAVGLMQLMPKYFPGAEKFSPEENIMTGTKYFSELMKKYNNIDLALAAYNAGMGRMSKSLKGGAFPEETKAYIPAVKNFAEIFKDDENKKFELLNRNMEMNKKLSKENNDALLAAVNDGFSSLKDVMSKNVKATSENKVSVRNPVITTSSMR